MCLTYIHSRVCLILQAGTYASCDVSMGTHLPTTSLSNGTSTVYVNLTSAGTTFYACGSKFFHVRSLKCLHATYLVQEIWAIYLR